VLPRSGPACPHCDATGIYPTTGRACLFCDGFGFAPIYQNSGGLFQSTLPEPVFKDDVSDEEADIAANTHFLGSSIRL